METSNSKLQTSNKIQSSNIKRAPFDLEDRATRFGQRIVAFCRTLEADHISRPIISQLVRASTSVGANYAEANNASSRRDFRNKVSITKKETQETKHWLKVLQTCFPDRQIEIENFWQEAHELNLIFQSIVSKVDSKVEV